MIKTIENPQVKGLAVTQYDEGIALRLNDKIILDFSSTHNLFVFCSMLEEELRKEENNRNNF